MRRTLPNGTNLLGVSPAQADSLICEMQRTVLSALDRYRFKAASELTAPTVESMIRLL